MRIHELGDEHVVERVAPAGDGPRLARDLALVKLPLRRADEAEPQEEGAGISRRFRPTPRGAKTINSAGVTKKILIPRGLGVTSAEVSERFTSSSK